MLARLVGARRGRGRQLHRLLRALHRPGSAEGGSLLCCDVSVEWTAIGADAWREAGLAVRMDVRIGPAIQTLRALPA